MILNNIKVVLFDMDGVLIDSMPYHSETWVKSFKEHGVVFSPEEAYLNEGSTGNFTINKVFNEQLGRNASQEEIDSIYNLKTELISTKKEAGTVENMPDFVSFVHSINHDLWVVTGSAQKSLIGRLEKFYPNKFFPKKMVTGRDVKIGKPHPEPYLKALALSGYSANEAIVIENAPLGVKSAKAAGIFTIAINTGILKDEVLKNANADIVLPNVKALKKWWKENVSND